MHGRYFQHHESAVNIVENKVKFRIVVHHWQRGVDRSQVAAPREITQVLVIASTLLRPYFDDSSPSFSDEIIKGAELVVAKTSRSALQDRFSALSVRCTNQHRFCTAAYSLLA